MKKSQPGGKEVLHAEFGLRTDRPEERATALLYNRPWLHLFCDKELSKF